MLNEPVSIFLIFQIVWKWWKGDGIYTRLDSYRLSSWSGYSKWKWLTIKRTLKCSGSCSRLVTWHPCHKSWHSSSVHHSVKTWSGQLFIDIDKSFEIFHFLRTTLYYVKRNNIINLFFTGSWSSVKWAEGKRWPSRFSCHIQFWQWDSVPTWQGDSDTDFMKKPENLDIYQTKQNAVDSSDIKCACFCLIRFTHFNHFSFILYIANKSYPCP